MRLIFAHYWKESDMESITLAFNEIMIYFIYFSIEN